MASDAVIIGSGIGGLAAGAALAHIGKRVLLLERHHRAGGLTQTFERNGFTFNTGLHYLGGFEDGGLNHRLFDRLSGGRIADQRCLRPTALSAVQPGAIAVG